MVKIREEKPTGLSEVDKAALADKRSREAIPKVKRTPPFKAITVPFKSEADYLRLVKAAQKANVKPTSFMITAIKVAIDKELGKH